jgi:acetylornithine deacetylase/succinyl-diaminopimelate desuccinylase-like protein
VLGAILDLPAVQEIQLNAIIARGEYQAYTGQTLITEKFFPAWLLPEEDEFLQRTLHGLQTAGLSPNTRAYRFCTNAAYSAGVAGVPTVGFGPAEESDAHVINERLRIEDLEKVARGYVGIIQAVLGQR